MQDDTVTSVNMVVFFPAEIFKTDAEISRSNGPNLERELQARNYMHIYYILIYYGGTLTCYNFLCVCSHSPSMKMLPPQQT